jgi:hypothetical protein
LADAIREGKGEPARTDADLFADEMTPATPEPSAEEVTAPAEETSEVVVDG